MNVLFIPLDYAKSNFAAAIQRDRVMTTHIFTIFSWLYLFFLFSESVKDKVYVQCLHCHATAEGQPAILP